MLQLSSSLLNRSVLSLRSGGIIAVTTRPIINPRTLKIEGLYCTDSFNSKKVLVLVEQDIREILPQGLIVNDHDVLTDPSDLVRLRDIINLRFDIIGKPVFTTDKRKVGKVVDYATELKSMYIQKIYVGQSIFKSLTGGNLGVDRNNIVEITDHKIVIQKLEKEVPAVAHALA